MKGTIAIWIGGKIRLVTSEELLIAKEIYGKVHILNKYRIDITPNMQVLKEGFHVVIVK